MANGNGGASGIDLRAGGQRVLITGGAGFIGSHLVDRLLALGNRVTVYDNFATGQREFLADALGHPDCWLVEGDLLDAPRLTDAVAGHDLVVHLAANADVRHGTEHPRRDLEQNTIATHNVLEALRLGGVPRLAFASTGSVYGEPAVFPTPEDAPFPVQTSLYAASRSTRTGCSTSRSHSGSTGSASPTVSAAGHTLTLSSSPRWNGW